MLLEIPKRETNIRSRTPSHLQDELLASIGGFPDEIKANLERISVGTEGAFPLFHPDFQQSNVIIDSDHNILSIIDWDNAGTVPWGGGEVDFPLFLDVVGRPMGLPTDYGTEGNPVDEQMRMLRKERNDYVQSVKAFEKAKGSRDNIFTILASSYTQNIATALGLYKNGKLGFNCKLL
jgi:hypothetical protein